MDAAPRNYHETIVTFLPVFCCATNDCDIQLGVHRYLVSPPRSQHSRVGMLRQNNQHTPARAAVLAAVLRTLAALIGGIYYYKNGLKLKLKLGAVIAQRACKDPGGFFMKDWI